MCSRRRRWSCCIHVPRLRVCPYRLQRDGAGEVSKLAHERGQALDHRYHARRGPRAGFAIVNAPHEDTQVGGQ
eukprot:1150467-Alexandrium_andersonii.AAC.1